MNTDQLKILCIDDDKIIIQILTIMLTKGGFLVYSASDPRIGIAIAEKLDPDLILLDIMMPEMNGYEVCRALQQDERTAKIPVVFMSALNQAQNKVSALAAGGVDYITKPLDRDLLLEVTNRYAGKKAAWAKCVLPHGLCGPQGGSCPTLADFKISVIDRFKLDGSNAKAVTALQHGDIYKLAGILNITPGRVARLIADFSKNRYFPVINPDDIKLGLLPVKFAMQNNIVAVAGAENSTFLAISHPFNFELNEMMRGIMGTEFEFGITEPSNISGLYRLAGKIESDSQEIEDDGTMVIEETALNRLSAAKSVKNETNAPHVKYLTGKLLQFLAEEKTAEIHIEAKGSLYLVRAGAADALEEFTRFNRMTGNVVVARLKALGGMDVVERHNPQKGSFSIQCRSENYRLMLSTESTEYGESLIVRPGG